MGYQNLDEAESAVATACMKSNVRRIYALRSALGAVTRSPTIYDGYKTLANQVREAAATVFVAGFNHATQSMEGCAVQAPMMTDAVSATGHALRSSALPSPSASA